MTTPERARVEDRPGEPHGRTRKKSRGTPDRSLGYRFDAIPQSLRDKIAEHAKLPPPAAELPQSERRKELNSRLRPVDALVLGVLLGFRTQFKTSCWCAKKTIAEKIGQAKPDPATGERKGPDKERTVQHSLRRLELHGFIAQRKVETRKVGSREDPRDPDEPANETGWRIHFLFIPGATKAGNGPDRRPPEERKVWFQEGTKESPEKKRVSSPLPSSDTAVSSAEEQPVSCPGEAPVSSKECAGASNQVLERPDLEETPTTSSSSSLRAPEPPDQVEAPELDDDDISRSEPEDSRREAVEAARICYGPEVAAEVQEDAPAIDRKIDGRWDLFTAAIFLAKFRKSKIRASHWAFFAAFVTNPEDGFARFGITAEAKRAREKILAAERQRAALASRAAPAAAPPPTPEGLEATIRQLEGDIAQAERDLADPGMPQAVRRVTSVALGNDKERLNGLRKELATLRSAAEATNAA